MLRVFLLLCFLCTSPTAVYGQSLGRDHIQKAFNNGSKYYAKAQLDSARFYFEKARELAYQTEGPTYWKGRTTLFLSLVLIETDTALSNKLFNVALDNAKQISKFNGGVASYYTDRANLFKELGDRVTALKLYNDGYDFIKNNLEDIGDSNSLIITLRSIVEFHLEVEDTERALELLNTSPLPQGTLNYELYESYGNVYMRLGNYDQALVYYYKALDHQKLDMLYKFKSGKEQDYKDLKTDTLALGYRMNSVAEAYLALDQLSKAEVYLDSASLYLSSNYDNLTLLANDRVLLALKFKDYVLTERWLNRVDEGLNILDDESEWQQYYASREELAVATGQFDEYQFWRAKKDSLDKQVLEEGRINILNTQRDLERQKEAQLRSAQEETLAQRRLINILQGAGLLILVVLVYYFAITSKKMRLLSSRNELLVREQNHRVKNNLQMINSLLSLQAGRLKDEQSKDVLKKSQTRIQAISLLNRSLYEQKDISHVNLQSYIKELSQDVVNSITEEEVNKQVEVVELDIDIDKATSLGLIINELTVNSVKHCSNQAGFDLQVTKDESQVTLHYKDHNMGFSLEAYQNSRSFGKRLIELQARQLKGKLSIQDSSQFELNLVFDL